MRPDPPGREAGGRCKMDIELYCEEYGSGEPLILLHGNGESSAYFAAQIGPLSARFRVFAVDTRGHGRSPRGTAPFTLDQFVEDLHAFLTARGVARAHILGFSDGGNIALLYALKYPETVDRLVLNGANLCPGGVRPAVQIPIVLAYAALWPLAPFFDGAKRTRELLGLMVTLPHIDSAALSALPMPVLVIAGTRDMIRTSHTRKIAQAIPRAQLALLEGDHFIAAKNSDAFNRAVLAFLTGGAPEPEKTDIRS